MMNVMKISWPSTGITRVCAVILIAYAASVALIYFGQRSMQYLPDRTNPSPAQTSVPEMQEVMIKTADGLTHESWAYIPATPNVPVVVMFHGNAEHVGARAPKLRTLIDAGFGVVIVGYRGYGGNPGAPTEEGLYHDARAVVNYVLRDKNVPENQLVFYGESLGSGVATKMADEHRGIAGLILEVPFDSALHVAQWRFPWIIGMDYLMKDPFRSDQRIANLKMPKLFLTAEDDWIVPNRFGRALYAMAPEPKQHIEYKDAGHNNLYSHGAGADVVSFIQKLPVSTPPVRVLTSDEIVPTSHMQIEDISFMSAGRERGRILAEIAQTSKDLENGLMGRTSLGEHHGMLFILPGNMIARFWMRDTLIPLDMVFIDQDGRIIKIHENAKPKDETTISSDFQVRAVLEINAGTAAKYGLAVGDLVISKALDAAVAASLDLNP